MLLIVGKKDDTVLFSYGDDTSSCYILTFPVWLTLRGERMLAVVAQEEQRNNTISERVPVSGNTDAWPDRVGSFTHEFITTFLEGRGPRGKVYFTNIPIWMGELRELALLPIAERLVQDMKSGQWGMVTNRSFFTVDQLLDSYDTVIGEVRLLEDTDLSRSFISLAFKWFKKQDDGSLVRARYLEKLGLKNEFPEDGYQGDYIYEIAQGMIDEAGDGFKDVEDQALFRKRAQDAIFADIDTTLKRIGIAFDSYYNEHTLYEGGMIEDVVAELRAKGLVYEQDEATWFKTSEFGQEQDRVIIKNTGEPTYRLPDIAYHREKFRRGFDWMINVFGADHIATVPDVLAGIEALGLDKSKVHVVLYQFVTLLRDGKQVKMSTRKATFVTVDELVDEVGVDALRFFFLMRKPDSQLEFDLELATAQSQENPVYYVQYAHARLCSIERMAREKGVTLPVLAETDLSPLQEEEEYQLLKTLASYPALVADAATDLAPHRVIFFLMELAGNFHSFYNKHKVVTEDQQLTVARLCLCQGVKAVLANGLDLVGIAAPEKM
ncbi:MAG: arginine--tRNA ligase [Candidatus Electrothrix sp. AR5]|nr:arginine--tRNA ligase [Candidatus Electrothrix sp. AR5]